MPMISMLVATSGFVWALGVFVVVVLFALWIYCLFDVLVRSSHGRGAKALWALALVLLAPFAIVAYLLVGRRG